MKIKVSIEIDGGFSQKGVEAEGCPLVNVKACAVEMLFPDGTVAAEAIGISLSDLLRAFNSQAVIDYILVALVSDFREEFDSDDPLFDVFAENASRLLEKYQENRKKNLETIARWRESQNEG